jgi:hypothetical protein
MDKFNKELYDLKKDIRLEKREIERWDHTERSRLLEEHKDEYGLRMRTLKLNCEKVGGHDFSGYSTQFMNFYAYCIYCGLEAPRDND